MAVQMCSLSQCRHANPSSLTLVPIIAHHWPCATREALSMMMTSGWGTHDNSPRPVTSGMTGCLLTDGGIPRRPHWYPARSSSSPHCSPGADRHNYCSADWACFLSCFSALTRCISWNSLEFSQGRGPRMLCQVSMSSFCIF